MTTLTLHEVDDEAAAGWSEHFERHLEGQERMFALTNALPIDKRLTAQRRMVLFTLEKLIPGEKFSAHAFDQKPEKRSAPAMEESKESPEDRALRKTQQQLGGISSATWERNARNRGEDVEVFRQQTWQAVYEANLKNG